MMTLVITGIFLVAVGVLIMGAKMGRKLEVRVKKSLLVRKIVGNVGEIFFVAGVLCIVAGLANLYYG